MSGLGSQCVGETCRESSEEPAMWSGAREHFINEEGLNWACSAWIELRRHLPALHSHEMETVEKIEPDCSKVHSRRMRDNRHMLQQNEC